MGHPAPHCGISLCLGCSGKPARDTLVVLMSDLIAYFDDSGHPDDQDAVVTAGWVATAEQWLRLEQQWKERCNAWGITEPFHMTEFETPGASTYANIPKEKRNGFLYSLLSLIRTRVQYGFLTIIPMADYKDANELYAIDQFMGAPFAIAGRQCIGQMKLWADRNKKNFPQIIAVFEDGTKHKGDLLEIFRRDEFPTPCFRKKSDVTAIQSSDLFAWESFKAFKTGIVRPSLQWLFDNVHHSKDIITFDDFVENCTDREVPKRMEGQEFDVRFSSSKKRPRKRLIFGSALDGQVRGNERL